MRLLTTIGFLLTALLLTSTFAFGETWEDKLKVGAEVRGRVEIHETDFNSDTESFNFSLLRTRLNLEFENDENVGAFVQIQDSRVFGEMGLSSGGTAEDENLGLHQAYAWIKDPYIEGVYAKFGRFEFVRGNQRIFGSVGWSNVGRSFDGAVAGWDNGNVDIHGFLFNIQERYIMSNDDYMLGGVYTEIEDPGIDLFFAWDRDGIRNSNDDMRLSRFTTGLYREGKFSDFDYNSNLAYQFGTTIFDSLDIQAYLVTLEIGYMLDPEYNARIALGADITSGDDDASDDKFKAFDNLYYTGHKFRGYMDYFVSQPEYGLNDIYGKGQFKIQNGPMLSLAAHIFSSNVDYVSMVDGEDARSIGLEFDASASHQLYENFKWEIGASAFMPSEDYAGEDSDPAFWLYLQTTVSLP